MRHLIAMPVYNEARHLERVLRKVKEVARDVLVVDDGSTDATPAILAQFPGLRVIRHGENLGYGQSVIDALRFADRKRYEWVVTIDCDEQHEPEQIPEFVRAMLRNDADVISGSRYCLEYPEDDAPPEDRRRINRAITDLLNQLLGLRLTDSFCGFKAHRLSAMRRLALDEAGYAFPLQFWVQAARGGARICEIPVRRIYRDADRQFGDGLDEPARRLEHYLEVLLRELRRPAAAPAQDNAAVAGCCRC
ncbi:MAG: Undecaprenyl-phosphate mannosyltransferase [Phycisphaerae bacterium]|nr:Undecaprenyl-phosphate mannosyltransferase [Phycisphaerae bacterium]